MVISTWMMIVAVLLAPLIAVQVQKWLEHYRERRGRKMQVFQALMATRNARVSPEHVRALNMIDLEFSGIRFFRKPKASASEQVVLRAWKKYREHLNIGADERSEDALAEWQRRGDEYFLALLAVMGKALGYDFDTVDLKRDTYAPRAFFASEFAQLRVRNFLVDVAMGKRAIPMEIRQPEQV